MNNILKVSKYQIHDFKKLVIIFYSIILLMLLATITVSFAKSPEEVAFGVLEMTTAVFLFVAGLNCFKSNFKFMLANNVSRKQFYLGTTIALASVAAFMSLFDTILGKVFGLNFPYESFVFQLYKNNTFIARFLWSFGLNTLFVCLGWFITMLYYRCNKVMKIVVSIAPIPIIVLFQYINRLSGRLVSKAAADFLYNAMGLAYNSAYVGALSFLAATAVITAICFLLIRNAIAKD